MSNFLRVFASLVGVLALVSLFNLSQLREFGYPKGNLPEPERHRFLGAEDQEVIVERIVTRGREQLNILTLGGSVTWGANIEDRGAAYPFILQNVDGHNVTNLAIRATGSDYPAQCISSMLKIEEERDGSTYDPSKPFDVIIFDFSINGMDGFELLLKRLQIRFPDAILIYVDLWSWHHGGNMGSEEAQQIVKEAGGYVYHLGNEAMPIEDFDFREMLATSKEEDIAKIFADDKHHLSIHGHKVVRHQVRNIIEWYGKIPERPRLGSWLGGDKCTSWYENGESPFHIFDGGEMKEWDENKHKWAIEVAPRGMVFEYFHDSTNAAPLNFQYMTKAPKLFNPYTSLYPPVIVKIEEDESSINEAKKCAYESKKVSVIEGDALALSTEATCLDDSWTFISGLQNKKGLRKFHITEISYAGMLKPGHNLIFVIAVGGRSELFRITATIVCEACGRLGWTEV